MQNSAADLYCPFRREAESLTTLIGRVSQPSYWHPYTTTRTPALLELHSTRRSALFAGHQALQRALRRDRTQQRSPDVLSRAVTSIRGAKLPATALKPGRPGSPRPALLFAWNPGANQLYTNWHRLSTMRSAIFLKNPLDCPASMIRIPLLDNWLPCWYNSPRQHADGLFYLWQ
jgi:hypothetical protein